jgi:hypothetical protein
VRCSRREPGAVTLERALGVLHTAELAVAVAVSVSHDKPDELPVANVDARSGDRDPEPSIGVTDADSHHDDRASLLPPRRSLQRWRGRE